METFEATETIRIPLSPPSADRHLCRRFCLPVGEMVVEVDGQLHASAEAAAHDARRDAYMRREGFRVLRVSNGEVVRNVEGVIETVMRELGIDVE